MFLEDICPISLHLGAGLHAGMAVFITAEALRPPAPRLKLLQGTSDATGSDNAWCDGILRRNTFLSQLSTRHPPGSAAVVIMTPIISSPPTAAAIPL